MIPGDEYAQLRDHVILPCTVGFFKPCPGGFQSVGAGTFVRIGGIHGVLTCAHVIDELVDETRIDLVLCPVRSAERFIPLNVKEHCAYLKFGPSNDENGPDLGFLKLPIPFFESINHLVSAKNLEIGKKDAFAEAEPSENYITVVVGMIGEWTPPTQQALPFMARGLVSVGSIEDRMRFADHDLFRFRPIPDENFPTPNSYGGTSGGGLWRIYRESADGSQHANRLLANRLVGVAFYETEGGQIICHGQASIYVKLLAAIREKWPDVT
jgi:hypothetical protein